MEALAPLIVILGPTASGKSALGIRLAQQTDGEIIVCDSTQVYRRFDIGTGKVSPADRHGIAHHLVDIIEPDELFTAGEYRRQALLVLDQLGPRGKLPILTAGTGLYLRALIQGLSDAPARSDELRARLRDIANRQRPAHLHHILARLDREAAARISPGDTQKVIRALEMRVLAGKPVGDIHRSGRRGLGGYQVTKIGLVPLRAELYVRIHARINAMLNSGWIDEVRLLIASGVPADAKPFQFIGYSQLRAHLEGNLSLGDAVQEIQQATRRFAKRQITWFRKEPDVHWISGFGDDPAVLAAALRRIRETQSRRQPQAR
jgi:tRNA dimethylallyltransferase